MNCFNCDVERACESCLDLVSQKKTYYTDNNVLRGKSAKEYHQILPWYVGEYKPKTSITDFEAAKEVLLTSEKSMIGNRRFERINKLISCKSYIKSEDVPENKEIFVYGFKQQNR